MDPVRGLIHLGLKTTEATLDRVLDVVRLVDTMLVSSAVPPVRERTDSTPTWPQEEQGDLDALSTALRERADRRLAERGVEAERVVWDSWKNDDTHWTVIVRFPAGGRQREATWLFDPVNRALRTVDDAFALRSEAQEASTAVVVGAGVGGLAAAALGEVGLAAAAAVHRGGEGLDEVAGREAPLAGARGVGRREVGDVVVEQVAQLLVGHGVSSIRSASPGAASRSRRRSAV